MAFCNLPCWTYFSAALRTFCLLNPKPKAIIGADSSFLTRRRSAHLTWKQSTVGLMHSPRKNRSGRTRRRPKAVVRRVTQIRMVTKGYRKGVYVRVTEGTWLNRERR